ncbi:DUF6151 family protein [Haliangium ochraceum]|uniref:CENP-V/GFA domain-containing protein n=1 Tax=Haliangium ochraceum (strain DSM 14365 / JCM 11303 / SMP-2) TaxID=502025 RepID=D0LWQ7_HALO1|nr:DUF6151 family protein [Haliangium ochraceum]ACY14154.1 conserved hypothetical protein [Haliangium ochraceum DSM 14365]
MPTDIPLQCTCGTLRGVLRAVTPTSSLHVTCYCGDCQTFAHVLGRADEILDERGGTEICQVSPAQLAFTAGQEQLACLRLSPRGLMRWYAACCDTPLGNTLASTGMPFFGCILALALPGGSAAHSDALGPNLGNINGGSARGPVEEPKFFGKVAVIGRFLRTVAGRRWRGEHKQSPLFDPASGEPVVTPRVLTLEQRQEAERARDAAR